ncbi:2'-5' RNA ligase family protein [Halobacillus sp. BBL2006]|uniref:2'-5' RNA ligase family protein n=1 Tax=Halobacillus sp. BBL2006 TaxID=1543706 RepID=UPI000ABB71DF
MKYFIGIVPAEDYKIKVIEFQKKWKNHWITDVVEPHITLKAQGGLTADKEWLNKVEEVCHDFKPFQIQLDKPMFFGEEVLYLSANSEELYKLHRDMVREISPSKELVQSYFELDDFVPHMTLGKTSYGLTKQELRDKHRKN